MWRYNNAELSVCVMLYSPHTSPRELPCLSLVLPSSLYAVGKEHILSSGQSKGKMVLQQTHATGSLPSPRNKWFHYTCNDMCVITHDGGQVRNPGSLSCKNGQEAEEKCTAPQKRSGVCSSQMQPDTAENCFAFLEENPYPWNNVLWLFPDCSLPWEQNHIKWGETWNSPGIKIPLLLVLRLWMTSVYSNPTSINAPNQSPQMRSTVISG